MKTVTLLFLVLLTACQGADPVPMSVWKIKYEDSGATIGVTGIITESTQDGQQTRIVNYGYVLEETLYRYILVIGFTTGDQLEIQLSRPDGADDYYFPAVEDKNQLDLAKFKGTQLNLLPSELLITPKTGVQRLSAYLEVASSTYGFTGHVSGIPVLKSLD